MRHKNVQILVGKVNERYCNGNLSERDVQVISKQICNLPWIYNKISYPLEKVDGSDIYTFTVNGSPSYDKVGNSLNTIKQWLCALLFNGIEGSLITKESCILPYVISNQGKLSLNEFLKEKGMTHFTLESLKSQKEEVQRWFKMIDKGYRADIKDEEVKRVVEYVFYMNEQVGKPLLGE